MPSRQGRPFCCVEQIYQRWRKSPLISPKCVPDVPNVQTVDKTPVGNLRKPSASGWGNLGMTTRLPCTDPHAEALPERLAAERCTQSCLRHGTAQLEGCQRVSAQQE